MNKQEKELFLALSKDRSESADTLEKPSMQGIKNSVVEKYSDQAHFIYELLQNADDAGATTVRFIIKPTRLIFAHNGKRHFSVSDPANEVIDSENKTLGDINSITSIANSNKTDASIGKFGVGFKAVFQYTQTPHIYDPNFRFKIERFIVPVLLENDFAGRGADETLFVFPFDHQERDAAEAYEDISNKLKGLTFPLLFLTNLKSIEYQLEGKHGLYFKNVSDSCVYGETIAEHIYLTQNVENDVHIDNMWIFSRFDECERKYSVGFFIDDDGHLKAVNEPAFCFFPTKEVTGLSFILHGPFLLTDSREGIRAGIAYNDKLIQRLADLAADAFEYLRDMGEKYSPRLIDDNIVSIIPVDENNFSDPSDKRKVSFLPFYIEIKRKFERTALLPSVNYYVSAENAYWASVPQLSQLFSNEQLRDITGNENASWVFPSLGRDELQRTNIALHRYIISLVRAAINEDTIINGLSWDPLYNRNRGARQYPYSIKGITADFIENQSFNWLHKFYKWLSQTKRRTELSRKKPLFLDQNRNAAAAFDAESQPILFLPVEGVIGYKVVHPELLKNPETCRFFEAVGIKRPSQKDFIYNIIIPQYQSNEVTDANSNFIQLFHYYCNCASDEVDAFIKRISDYEILTYYDGVDSKPHRGQANSMYLPTEALVAYFESKKDTRFVALSEYRELVGSNAEKQLISFFTELGIRKEISILLQTVDYDSCGRNDLPDRRSTRGKSWEEHIIDGCREIVQHIVSEHDDVSSSLLWNSLLRIIEEQCNSQYSLDSLLQGTFNYFFRSPQHEHFASSTTKMLREQAWVQDVNGRFCVPSELHLDSISDIYETSSEYAIQLIDFLGISSGNFPNDEEEEDDSNLTESQRKSNALLKKLKEYGIEDIDDFEEGYGKYLHWKETERKAAATRGDGHRTIDPVRDDDDFDNLIHNADESFQDEDSISEAREKRASRKATTDVFKDIFRRTRDKASAMSATVSTEDEEPDEDEFMPSAVDYSKKIERAKEKSVAEIDRIAHFEELHNKAVQLTRECKYTFAWFNTLLEMESINSGEVNVNSKEVSISFARIEREIGTRRTLILKQPNRYIPQFMEDLADIPMVLHMSDQKKTVAIEVVNIKSYTLRVKLKNEADIDGVELDKVSAATIDAKSPAFLLEELRKQFSELGLSDDFNMKDNLCDNIEFVFGPPGTGKTTHLARNVLIPMMMGNKKRKVLVLTPTNKAADVLVKRIMEVSAPDTSYENWLVRFGSTADEEIEQSAVFRDKTFDIRTLSKNVTVTTISRFPYDFFMPQGARIFLWGINWDYIVIDEASMIPIANIIFPLYARTPRKFIISGDPFQIEPIASVEIWKNENIYTMVELDSFVAPRTKPHQYKVELLTTQYRSVPAIGGLFSAFAYGGILNHYRSESSQRKINLANDFGIKTLNVIKYPVSKYESIYRSKKLQHSSSYQVYSALFTFEYVCFLSRAIAESNRGALFRIGVIAPYRAQADMIDKLLASERLPLEIDVQVGTIHGFQGDECDIVFAVFNTPPTISGSKEMFLNKRNIINVSISRAKDYLFIIMPDDNTEGISNLRLVKHVEELIHKTDVWNEFLSPELERFMFNDPNYLENNAFSTGHQSVNVYGLPEKCYEVRTEDNAVDVQIHREKAKDTKEPSPVSPRNKE